MWQQYSQEVSCSNPAELDFKVGRQAFEAGIGQKEIALMLAAGSPTVKYMIQGQRKSQATKYVNQVARIICRDMNKKQYLRSKLVLERQIELGD
jgi:hypothetical protein